MAARVYVTGRVAIERAGSLVDEYALPGRQGRLAFVFLTLNRHRPVARHELVDVIWPDGPPAETDAALSAILSKLRGVLRKAGWTPDQAAIDVRSGAFGLRIPGDTWVDIEAAQGSIDEAEGFLRVLDALKAWGHANVTVSISRRPFLTDLDAPWIETRRATQRTLLTRGLQALAAASEQRGQPDLALQYATELLDLEPFRESEYRRLMQLHAAMGNRAEALRVFERCRHLLREELGASPSPQTEAVFLEILRAGG